MLCKKKRFLIRKNVYESLGSWAIMLNQPQTQAMHAYYCEYSSIH